MNDERKFDDLSKNLAEALLKSPKTGPAIKEYANATSFTVRNAGSTAGDYLIKDDLIDKILPKLKTAAPRLQTAVAADDKILMGSLAIPEMQRVAVADVASPHGRSFSPNGTGVVTGQNALG